MKQAYLKYRRCETFFQIPSNWNVLTFAAFEEHPARDDIQKMVRTALKNPVSTPPLSKVLSQKDNIAIIIEDLTRTSPKKEVLTALLTYLEQVGLTDRQIVIVIALGTHRQLSRDELIAAFGQRIMNRYEVINHDCKASDLVPIGHLKTGSEVKINARVHQATYKIGIGSIFPHPLNGFGGGNKILFPGVSDYDSILEHHLKYAFRHGSDLGKIENNLFYEEINQLAAAAKLNFILNSVLDHNDRLYDIVAGDPINAQQQGIEICRRIVSKNFKQKADLTIITSFPYNEGNQIMKPLAPAGLITKKGGTLILVADCTIPFAEEYLSACEAFRKLHGDHLHQAVFSRFDHNQLILEDSAPELNMSMAQALLAQDDFQVILVSEDIEADQVKRIGFDYAPTLEEAFVKATEYCAKPSVNIVPSGGVILPIVGE